MSKGYSGLFEGTKGAIVGSSYLKNKSDVESYTERGIEIPEHIKINLSKLQEKGDVIIGAVGEFSMSDVSIMSKETGVEFAHVTIDGKTYLIRGDVHGTVIPTKLLKKMERNGGTWDFHSHPHDDDCIPSKSDKLLMHKLHQSTGQQHSIIVTPNGRISDFDEYGVKETRTVSNTLDEARKQALISLFGGKK